MTAVLDPRPIAARPDRDHRAAPGEVAAAIPAYQAATSIGAGVRGARRHVRTVLVVDDGSTDDTAAAARAAGAEVLCHAANRGKGGALDTALSTLFARGFEWVLTLDADGQHLPSEIPKLLAHRAPGVDLVLGSRAHLFAQMGGVRRVSNRLSSRFISWLAGCALDDVQTGFRLYRRRLYLELGMPERRFDAESAIVVRAGRRGRRLVTVPIGGRADGRASSHYRTIVDGLRIGRSVVLARLEGIA